MDAYLKSFHSVVWNASYRRDYVEYCIANVKTETWNLLIHVCICDRFVGQADVVEAYKLRSWLRWTAE